MIKRFTLAEIDALSKFYGSPEGKSIIKKFGSYMADMMPVIQSETMKAISKKLQGSSTYTEPQFISPF
jgi:hypothetical protein